MDLVKSNLNEMPAVASLFDAFFNGNPFDYWVSQKTGPETPPVNIRETDEKYCLELAAPGMNKSDFNIELDDQNRMVISSEKKTENNEEDGQYSRREFSYSMLKRSFVLPEWVDKDQIEATCADGVLRLTIPKNKELMQPKKRIIEIK
jgi:HSP20 family protein